MESMDLLLGTLFFVVAVLYTTVGHAGASGYLAVMGLAGVAPEVMRPTALLLLVVLIGLKRERAQRGRAAVAEQTAAMAACSAHEQAEQTAGDGAACERFRAFRRIETVHDFSARLARIAGRGRAQHLLEKLLRIDHSPPSSRLGRCRAIRRSSSCPSSGASLAANRG